MHGVDPPVLTVRCTTRHGPEEVRVDLDHLLHRPRCCPTISASNDGASDEPRGLTDIAPRRRPRIDRDDDPALEAECECGRPVGELDLRFWVGGHGIGVEGEERGGLDHNQRSDLQSKRIETWGRERTSGTLGMVIPFTPPPRDRFPNPPILPHPVGSTSSSS